MREPSQTKNQQLLRHYPNRPFGYYAKRIIIKNSFKRDQTISRQILLTAC